MSLVLPIFQWVKTNKTVQSITMSDIENCYNSNCQTYSNWNAYEVVANNTWYVIGISGNSSISEQDQLIKYVITPSFELKLLIYYPPGYGISTFNLIFIINGKRYTVPLTVQGANISQGVYTPDIMVNYDGTNLTVYQDGNQIATFNVGATDYVEFGLSANINCSQSNAPSVVFGAYEIDFYQPQYNFPLNYLINLTIYVMSIAMVIMLIAQFIGLFRSKSKNNKGG